MDVILKKEKVTHNLSCSKLLFSMRRGSVFIYDGVICAALGRKCIQCVITASLQKKCPNMNDI